jgi:hypothetical protein
MRWKSTGQLRKIELVLGLEEVRTSTEELISDEVEKQAETFWFYMTANDCHATQIVKNDSYATQINFYDWHAI